MCLIGRRDPPLLLAGEIRLLQVEPLLNYCLERAPNIHGVDVDSRRDVARGMVDSLVYDESRLQ